MKYYKHHTKNYAVASTHLTFVKDVTYSRLLQKYYAIKTLLPSKIESVQRFIKARTKKEKNAVVNILITFFTLIPKGWRQLGCDAVITGFKDGQNEARRKGGVRRWLMESPYKSRFVDKNTELRSMRTQCERNANAMLTRHQTPDTRHQSPYSSHQTNNKTMEKKIKSFPRDTPAPRKIKSFFRLARRVGGLLLSDALLIAQFESDPWPAREPKERSLADSVGLLKARYE